MSCTRFLSIVGLLALVGCAMTPYSASFQESKYQRADKTPYAHIYWNCVRSGQVLTMEGYLETSFDSRPLQHLTLRLEGVDDKGGKVSEARGYGEYRSVTVGRPSPFRVVLPLAGAEKRVDMTYSYEYKDDQGERTPPGSRVSPLLHLVAYANFAWTVTDACPL